MRPAVPRPGCVDPVTMSVHRHGRRPGGARSRALYGRRGDSVKHRGEAPGVPRPAGRALTRAAPVPPGRPPCGWRVPVAVGRRREGGGATARAGAHGARRRGGAGAPRASLPTWAPSPGHPGAPGFAGMADKLMVTRGGSCPCPRLPDGPSRGRGFRRFRRRRESPAPALWERSGGLLGGQVKRCKSECLTNSAGPFRIRPSWGSAPG